jgi:hypothetical protein
MIELNENQQRELRQSNRVRVSDPETQREYVIVSADVYDRLESLVWHDSDWTPHEQLALLAESGKRAGWNDPEMDVYDDYDEHYKKLWQ